MVKSEKHLPVHQVFPLPPFELLVISHEMTSPAQLTHNDFMGKISVLFLYPKDDTSGCTQEAKDFSALMPEFTSLGVSVLGLSKDSIKKHQSFIKKYDLFVPLIADEETSLITALGAWQEKSLYGRKYMGTDRSTFVINSEGVVIMSWRKVKVGGHVQDVLEYLKSLNG